jgi:hypothetical protein
MLCLSDAAERLSGDLEIVKSDGGDVADVDDGEDGVDDGEQQRVELCPSSSGHVRLVLLPTAP